MSEKIKQYQKIFLADPNELIATTNKFSNATPSYQDMTPYVELYCIRKKGITINLESGNYVRNEGNQISYSENTGYTIDGENSVQKINFLNFDQKTQTYTTKYATSDILNVDNSTSNEGFGITNISLRINANYMPMVEITFVDVRGSALLFEGEKSPLAALFDYPPPIFKLRMKGVFGKFVEYDLHMTGNDVSFTDSGNYEIKARFIGEFFGPLTDVLLGYLKSVPYLKNKESSLDGNSPYITELHGGQITTVNSFFELINKGELLYAKIDNFKKNSSAIEQIQKLKELPNKINNILTYLTSLSNDSDTLFKDYIKKLSGTSSATDKVKKSTYKNNQYTVSFSFVKTTNELSPTYIASEDFQLKSYVENYVNVFLLKNIQALLEGLNTSNPPLNLDASKFIDKNTDTLDSEKYTYYINYQRLYSELNAKLDECNKNVQKLQLELQDTFGEIVTQNIDFYPTIGNVFEIVLRDFDYFLSEIKKAGEAEKSTFSFESSSDSSAKQIGDAPWPEVVNRISTEYNRANGNSIIQDALVYPGAVPRFANWAEVQLVERYCASLVEQVRQEAKIDSFKTAIDNSKAVPLFPLEAVYINLADSTNQYISVDSLPNLYRTLLNRYIVTRDFAYPIVFNAEENDNYHRTFKDDVSYFNTGARVINQDTRKALIKSLAKAEANNAANALAGTLILTALNEINGNKINVIQQELGDALKANSTFLSSVEDSLFLKENKTVVSINFRKKNLFYRNNSNFQGIREIIDPETTEHRGLITKKIPDGSDYDNERLELLKSIGDTVWGSGDALTPIISEVNTLIFKDIRANSSTNRIDTDFVGGGSEIEGGFIIDILAEQVAFVLNSLNPLQELTKTLDTADKFFFYVNNKADNIAGDENLVFKSIVKKFLYPGAVEVPYWYVLFIGYKLKKNILNFGNNLSVIDKKVFVDYYSNFEKNYTNDVFDNIKLRLNSDAPSTPGQINYELYEALKNKIKDYNYFKILTKPRYIINDSSGTFLNPDNFTVTPPITGFRSAKLGTTDATLDLYLDTFFSELTNSLQTSAKKNDAAIKEVQSKITDNDFKSNIYYSFKTIYDRWLAGKSDVKNTDSSILTNSLYERFKFITRSQQNIADICIVDFQSLIPDSKGEDTNVYTAISNILSRNQFMFFPLHSFMDYDEGSGAYENWQKSFQISNELSSENISKPAFVCMYVGSYSSRLPSGQKGLSYQDDGFTIDNGDVINPNLPVDYTDGNNSEQGNIYAFRVRVGSQTQTIFSGFSMNTTEFKNTDISLKTEDDIINKQTEVSRPTKSQSLLNVYKQRSYSVGATIPFGNLCIQPTQYFQMEGIPIWNGTYIVYSVQHEMSADNNRINTSFKGYRLGKYVLPVVSDFLMSFLGINTDINTQIDFQNIPVNINSKYNSKNDNPSLAYSSLIPYEQPIKDKFIEEVINIGKRLRLNPSGLMAVMYLESGLRANIVSTSQSHATGLIQFVGKTAVDFTSFYNRYVKKPSDPTVSILTLSTIRSIDPVSQLKLVEEYLRRGLSKNGKLKTFWNMYLTIFQPKYQDASDSTILYSSGSREYSENSVFDRDRKGYVTIRDFKETIYKRVASDLGQTPQQFDIVTN